MVGRAGTQGSLSVEDYLEMEKTATVRHEYVAGEVYAMVGVSRRHSRIAGNIFRLLAVAAAGGPCRVHQSDMKLQIEDVFYYPDVMVACDDEPDDPYYENGPCLVVEVVSPSTESTDRREKLAAYKRIPGLKAYLIVDQERVRIERHFRDEEGVWLRADLVDEGRLPVPCPETSLTLAEIYEGL
jgi:Uma2 family endonuclease